MDRPRHHVLHNHHMADPASQPLVTIVTPTLNQADFLSETLDSVARQTYPAIEHIVIDGGSGDGTQAILDGWTAHKIQWSTGKDRGMYDAINKGLASANGAVVCYLNSDDVLLPWAVADAVKALQRSGADVIFGDGLRLDVSGQYWPRIEPPFRRDQVVRHGSLVQPSVFWRREVLARAGAFDAELRYVGDLDYWLRTSANGRVVKVRDVFSVFRDHPDALSRKAKTTMRAEEDRVRATYMAEGRVFGTFTKLLARFVLETRRRGETLRFALACRGRGMGWSNSTTMRPTVSWGGLLVAMIPLVGRRQTRSWYTLGAPPLPSERTDR